ncbi:MAG TPA: hypothetical protein VM694_35955 [Polyangium sp.]|nr:hypothetical protein [Polyangium sp.]
MRHSMAALILLVLAGCGSSTPPAEEPKTETQAEAATDTTTGTAEAPKAEEEAKGIPEACAGDDKAACVMPKGFVKRLCNGVYPELALFLFQKGSPWRRAYVSAKEVAPFNGLGGPSAEEKLTLDEELLVLSQMKADTGGMQVSGATGSVDVLRWDGTCATLSTEEVRFQAPSKPKHAIIPWRILEDATQEALKQNEALAKVATERKKECKGATMGAVSAKCEKADKALNDLVVDAVRTGTTVPKPAKAP